MGKLKKKNEKEKRKEQIGEIDSIMLFEELKITKQTVRDGLFTVLSFFRSYSEHQRSTQIYRARIFDIMWYCNKQSTFS